MPRACVGIVILSSVDIGSAREKEYLNPDIAIGTHFHVAAKQWD